ncbi:ATP-binding protein, partial [Streptomonospora nanhaiensis]|nr:hypothetical protein [Streptomonospora nanhaiensis]
MAPSTPWTHFSTPLIGRDAELDALQRRLADPAVRVLTITGPVGVGKSALAAAVFRAVAHRFGAGAAALDVESARTESAVADRLLRALPPATAPGAPRPAARFLLAVDGGPGLGALLGGPLARALAERPEVTVLVAAREALGVYGEEVFPLRALPVPAPGPRRGPAGGAPRPEALLALPSVRLFVSRARAARPGFRLTPGNAEAVARLCERTDGLPLAIELAAGQLKLYTPQDVLAVLESDLGVLAADGGCTLSRHADMRAAIDSCAERLCEGDLDLLGRVAAYHDGVDLAAAAALAGGGTARARVRVARLVDAGLLSAEEADAGEAAHGPAEPAAAAEGVRPFGGGGLVFRVGGLTKRYVLERLRRDGRLEEALRAHARHLLDLVAAGPWAPPRRVPGRWRVDAESAQYFLLDTGDVAGAVRLACALAPTWPVGGGLRRTATFLEEALRDPALGAEAAIDAGSALGELLTWQGEHARAGAALEAALAAARLRDEPLRAAIAERRLGALAVHRGDHAAALPLLRGALDAVDALRALHRAEPAAG